MQANNAHLKIYQICLFQFKNKTKATNAMIALQAL